jgi:hypothetical protein
MVRGVRIAGHSRIGTGRAAQGRTTVEACRSIDGLSRSAKMIKDSDGNIESSEAALRAYLDAMVQTNKGRPIRDATIKQSFER